MVRPCVARGFRRSGFWILHQCIRPLIGAFVLPAIMDISAHPISLAVKPQRAVRVTSVRLRREDRPPSLLILSQTSAGKLGSRRLHHTLLLPPPFPWFDWRP